MGAIHALGHQIAIVPGAVKADEGRGKHLAFRAEEEKGRGGEDAVTGQEETGADTLTIEVGDLATLIPGDLLGDRPLFQGATRRGGFEEFLAQAFAVAAIGPRDQESDGQTPFPCFGPDFGPVKIIFGGYRTGLGQQGNNQSLGESGQHDGAVCFGAEFIC